MEDLWDYAIIHQDTQRLKEAINQLVIEGELTAELLYRINIFLQFLRRTRTTLQKLQKLVFCREKKRKLNLLQNSHFDLAILQL